MMPNRLRDLRLAHEEGSPFHPAEMEILDFQVNWTMKNRSFTELDEEQKFRLWAELNSVGSIYRSQLAWGRPPTQLQMKSIISDIDRHAHALLDLLGCGPDMGQDGIMTHHVMLGGIFETGPFPVDQDLEFLQNVARRARSRLNTDYQNARPRKRSKDEYLYQLYNDLGMIYRQFWGGFKPISVSVNGNGGGPAVRFFQFTIGMIRGEDVSAQEVKDALRTMKRELSPSGKCYEIFSESEQEKTPRN